MHAYVHTYIRTYVHTYIHTSLERDIWSTSDFQVSRDPTMRFKLNSSHQAGIPMTQ